MYDKIISRGLEMKKYLIAGITVFIVLAAYISLNSLDDDMNEIIVSPTEGSVGTLKEFESEISKSISTYFSGFNHVEDYSQVSTENFIRQVYYRCFGEEGTTLESMVEELKAQEGNLLRLKTYRIEYLLKDNESEVHLTVTRIWEDTSRDQMSYFLRKINNQWKFDELVDEF
jgi:hypothetical protein